MAEQYYLDVQKAMDSLEQVGNNTLVKNGNLQSPQYVPLKQGYTLRPDGFFEAVDGRFNGTIITQDITIAGRTIGVDTVEEIRTALTELTAEGGGTIRIAAGTYVFTTSLALTDNIVLQGDDRSTTTLVFVAGAQLQVIGGSAYSTGTVSVSQGGTTVTGSGTSWLTNVAVGDKIRLNGFWTKVTNVATDTSLTIEIPFGGAALSGASYVVATTIDFVSVRDLTLVGSSSSDYLLEIEYATFFIGERLNIIQGSSGLKLNYAGHIALDTVITLGNTNNGFDITETSYLYFVTGYSASNGGKGYYITNSNNAIVLIACVAQGNTGNGYDVQDSSDILWNALVSTDNGSNGFYTEDCTDLIISVGKVSANAGDGIELNSNADRVLIFGSPIRSNGGYGVNIANSNCNDTVIVSNLFSGNASGAVNDSGTSTLIRGNVGVNDNSTSSTTVSQLTKAFTAGESLAVGDAVYLFPISTTNTHTIDLERGSSQYLSCADSASLSITGDMTLELWVYLESAPSSGEIYEILNKYEETGNQQSYGLYYQNNAGTPRLVFLASSGGSSNVEMAKNQTISTATWTHVAITYTASTGTTEFFINGSSIGTTAGGPASIFNSTADFRIGARATPTVANYFDGYIDEVRVWNAVRSTANINFYKNKPLAGTETNLQAYWQLNNALTDATSNGNNLTNNGSAVFQSGSLPFTGGDVFKTDADITGAYESFIGFNTAIVAGGASATIAVAGETSTLSGLTRGSTYYVSGTSGAITTSSAAPTRRVGIATSATSLLITNIPN